MKISNNLLFGLCAALILLGGDLLFSQLEPNYNFVLTGRLFFIFWFCNTILSFLPSRKALFGIYGFIFSLSLFQMAHLSFFGGHFLPIEVYLSFTQIEEVLFSLQDMLALIWLPLSVLAFCGVLLFISSRFLLRSRVQTALILPLILLLIPFAALRTLTTGNDFGKQPEATAATFYNAYGSISYFAGKIIPHKLSPQKFDVIAGPVIERRDLNANIILIMGESMGTNHLSLYGYSRNTTPNLLALSQEGSFVYKKAVACGVSTNVSLPLFFNGACSTESQSQIDSTNTCLFRLAKENGFVTSFLSAQSGSFLQGIMSQLCPSYIDYYQTADQGEGSGLMSDQFAVSSLRKLDWTKNNFVVLHHRSPHTPYAEGYPAEFSKYPTEGLPTKERLVNSYDNAIGFIDSLTKEVIENIQEQSDKPVYVLFTADHGEALGEGGRFGHLQLFPEQFTVPFWVYSNVEQEPLSQALRKEDRLLTHLEIHHMLAYLMGYHQTPLDPQVKTKVIGLDLDGSGGYLDLEFRDEKIVKSELF